MLPTPTCIIDKDVQSFLSLKESLAELPHAAQVGQIQLHVSDVQAVTFKLDFPHSLLCSAGVSAGDDDSSSS